MCHGIRSISAHDMIRMILFSRRTENEVEPTVILMDTLTCRWVKAKGIADRNATIVRETCMLTTKELGGHYYRRVDTYTNTRTSTDAHVANESVNA
jgi:hypothetical protein